MNKFIKTNNTYTILSYDNTPLIENLTKKQCYKLLARQLKRNM